MKLKHQKLILNGKIFPAVHSVTLLLNAKGPQRDSSMGVH